MLVFTMILALFPGIGDLLFVKVAFRAPKVTSSRKGTAHRQNLYTQTPDSPHACGRLVKFACFGSRNECLFDLRMIMHGFGSRNPENIVKLRSNHQMLIQQLDPDSKSEKSPK